MELSFSVPPAKTSSGMRTGRICKNWLLELGMDEANIR